MSETIWMIVIFYSIIFSLSFGSLWAIEAGRWAWILTIVIFALDHLRMFTPFPEAVAWLALPYPAATMVWTGLLATVLAAARGDFIRLTREF